MVDSISKKIINSISTNEKYNEDKLEQMEYVLKVLLNELIKTILVITIFSAFGYFKEIIIIDLTMCVIKPFIGGYHENTQINCFVATLILEIGILILSLQCNIGFISNCILISLSIFCIWNQAPIINSKMPISRPQLLMNNRIRGLSTSIFLGALSVVLYNYSIYYSLITWTILFQAILMFNKRES
jgi:accessory gene regulator B